MGSSSSQQPVTQQTTQTKDPWSAAQPHLQATMNAAQSLYNTGTGYIPYSGATVAPLQPALVTGINSQYGQALANLGGTAGVKAGQNLGLQQIQNYGLSPEQQSFYNQLSTQQNPYLQGVINQQINQANAGASGMGRYGSGAHDAAIAQAISPTLAQDYMQRQQMRQQMLESGQQRAGNWATLMPSLDAASYDPAQRVASAGQYLQDRDQQALTDQIKQYNAIQSYPWEQLARYNAIVGGAGGLGGTQITTSPGATQPSTLNRILGGAAAGAGIGTMFGPGIGTGIGALGGGLLGLMG